MKDKIRIYKVFSPINVLNGEEDYKIGKGDTIKILSLSETEQLLKDFLEKVIVFKLRM